MFLHLSVSHSVHREDGLLGGGGCAWLGGVPGPRGLALVSQHALRQTPLPQTATVADDTHPTGMHSCLIYDFAGVQID